MHPLPCPSELVPEELTAALREDRRTAGETCARYYWLLLAEGHLSRRLVTSMLRMIAALLPARRLGNAERQQSRAPKSSSGGSASGERGRLEAGNKARKVPQGPERAAMPPKTGL